MKTQAALYVRCSDCGCEVKRALNLERVLWDDDLRNEMQIALLRHWAEKHKEDRCPGT